MRIDKSGIDVGPLEVHGIVRAGYVISALHDGGNAQNFSIANRHVAVDVVEAIALKLGNVRVHQSGIHQKGGTAACDTHNEQCKKGVQMCFHARKVGREGRTFATKNCTWTLLPLLRLKPPKN